MQEVTTGRIKDLIEVTYDQIYGEVKSITSSRDSTNSNEQAFYSPDYGKITHRQILKICESPFRGVPSRIDRGKTDNQRVQAQSLIFDKEILEKVGKTFEIITEIKILEIEDPYKEQNATEQRNFSLYREMEENEVSKQSKSSNWNSMENDSDHTNEEQIIEKLQDKHNDNIDNAIVQNVSDVENTTHNKNELYTSTAWLR